MQLKLPFPGGPALLARVLGALPRLLFLVLRRILLAPRGLVLGAVLVPEGPVVFLVFFRVFVFVFRSVLEGQLLRFFLVLFLFEFFLVLFFRTCLDKVPSPSIPSWIWILEGRF